MRIDRESIRKDKFNEDEEREEGGERRRRNGICGERGSEEVKALYYPRLAAACLSWNSRTAGFDFNINIFIFFIFILPFLHFHSFLSTLSSSSGSQFKVFWSDSLIEIPQLSLGPLLPLKHPHAVHSHGFSANPRFQGLSHTCQCPKVAGTHVAGAGLGFSLFSAFSDVTSHAKRHNARRYPDWATSPPLAGSQVAHSPRPFLPAVPAAAHFWQLSDSYLISRRHIRLSLQRHTSCHISNYANRDLVRVNELFHTFYSTLLIVSNAVTLFSYSYPAARA